ncbi:uncharacterized protein LOC128351701 isoform X1 [Hemicordylus capensis]|uniref:uncharacterized protein LOC128351701 isoform X1 n=1 Tax=Hemicordylus capensis TaxID=884348 RepID=UPI0023034431|nr:uncharacterized protein LOC128351701 isoform X1 [Hemicordylus capensis]
MPGHSLGRSEGARALLTRFRVRFPHHGRSRESAQTPGIRGRVSRQAGAPEIPTHLKPEGERREASFSPSRCRETAIPWKRGASWLLTGRGATSPTVTTTITSSSLARALGTGHNHAQLHGAVQCRPRILVPQGVWRPWTLAPKSRSESTAAFRTMSRKRHKKHWAWGTLGSRQSVRKLAKCAVLHQCGVCIGLGGGGARFLISFQPIMYVGFFFQIVYPTLSQERSKMANSHTVRRRFPPCHFQLWHSSLQPAAAHHACMFCRFQNELEHNTHQLPLLHQSLGHRLEELSC